MTSAEFATKYRVLKTLSDAGARSELAQEIALGRMVIVHSLAAATPAERQTTLDRVRALPDDAASKVFGAFDVDDAPVIVTHFIPNFTSFAAWLDGFGSAPAPARAPVDDVQTAATVIMAAPVAPRPVSPTPAPDAPVAPPAPTTSTAPQTGGFTAVFGAKAVASPATPVSTPAAPAPPATPPSSSIRASWSATP